MTNTATTAEQTFQILAHLEDLPRAFFSQPTAEQTQTLLDSVFPGDGPADEYPSLILGPSETVVLCMAFHILVLDYTNATATLYRVLAA